MSMNKVGGGPGHVHWPLRAASSTRLCLMCLQSTEVLIQTSGGLS